MVLARNQNLKRRSQELRNDATKEEKHLWYDFLCLQKERWRRQVIIGCFIVDFYCSSAKLAIELDGSQHYTEQGKEYDRERSIVLAKHAVRVLRFSNLEVQQNFSGVCETISRAIAECMLARQNPEDGCAN